MEAVQKKVKLENLSIGELVLELISEKDEFDFLSYMNRLSKSTAEMARNIAILSWRHKNSTAYQLQFQTDLSCEILYFLTLKENRLIFGESSDQSSPYVDRQPSYIQIQDMRRRLILEIDKYNRHIKCNN